MEFEKKDKTQKLVIERIIEITDANINNELRRNQMWHNIANYENHYNLEMLLNDGWEIVDVKVSTAIGYSNGYIKKQDHTIIILEKNQ
jgi:hypothetical protein